MYQHQQQQQQPQQFYQQPGYLAGGPPHQTSLQNLQGMPNSPGASYQVGAPINQASLNPYSKPPTASIARPPSATIYQQGYK